MIRISGIQGSRQRQRAQMIVDQIRNERAKWEAPDTLLLAIDTQHEALAQWIKDETLLKGTLVTLVHYRQHCDCPGGYQEQGRKNCQGHEDYLLCSFSGYPLRWWLEKWKNSPDCNGIVGYLNGVSIGGM